MSSLAGPQRGSATYRPRTMEKLEELLRFALDQLVADGPAEIVFECREDGLHIRELIDGTWHRVVPVAIGSLRNSYGLQGDLFDAVLAFFQAEVPNDGRTTGQPINQRTRALIWHVDGKQVRVTFEN
jgi:hypothetical protein